MSFLIQFEKVIIIFDQPFLKKLQDKYKTALIKFNSPASFLEISTNERIPDFIRSLMPYYTRSGKIDKTFADLKREELLIILLQKQPELAGVFFDYGIPEKINLEELMNRNYKFNVSIQHFAYMTDKKNKNHPKFILTWALKTYRISRLHLKNYLGIHPHNCPK